MSRRIIIDELDFEVPYGKLAAKTWHEETNESKRVLALHGWMDNAGSFDNLIPHLKHEDGLYVVALDLPGHGKSSQLPPGSSYSDLNMVLEIRRCLIELKWVQPIDGRVNGQITLSNSNSFDNINNASINDNNNQDNPKQKKFTIIGHSLGAGLGLYYASLYPDDVEELILLDFIKSQTFPLETLLDNTAKKIDQFLTTVPSQSPFASPRLTNSSFSANHSIKLADRGQVIVSQEAAIIATIEAHKQLGLLSREDAKCLLKRSTIAVSTPPNGVIYSRDLRLQSMLNFREHVEINKIMFGRGACHIISILSKQGLYTQNEAFKDNLETMKEFYKTRAKSHYIEWLDADHYLHMNKPLKTAEIINKYIISPADYEVITE